MHHSESVVARLRRFASRTLTRAGTLALWAGSPANRPLRTCQALKRLSPEAEAGCPDKSRATCRTALLSGLVVAAVAFINVAIAALHTFTEVRNEKATWTKFGAIVVVGVVLLVAVIWLLGKSADILL